MLCFLLASLAVLGRPADETDVEDKNEDHVKALEDARWGRKPYGRKSGRRKRPEKDWPWNKRTATDLDKDQKFFDWPWNKRTATDVDEGTNNILYQRTVTMMYLLKFYEQLSFRLAMEQENSKKISIKIRNFLIGHGIREQQLMLMKTGHGTRERQTILIKIRNFLIGHGIREQQPMLIKGGSRMGENQVEESDLRKISDLFQIGRGTRELQLILIKVCLRSTNLTAVLVVVVFVVAFNDDEDDDDDDDNVVVVVFAVFVLTLFLMPCFVFT
ncbi:hypothetical protein ACROYT_G017692 [Oculina patagonica]